MFLVLISRQINNARARSVSVPRSTSNVRSQSYVSLTIYIATISCVHRYWITIALFSTMTVDLHFIEVGYAAANRSTSTVTYTITN